MVPVVAVVLLAGLDWFYRSTMTGRAMRALAQNPVAAGLMGIDVRKMALISFAAAAALGAFALISLALFWTSVKMEYRTYVAQSDDSQEIKVALGDRMSYLGERALSTGNMDLSDTSYVLLSRLAYTDIFGSVIGVQDAQPEPIPMRQWTEALEHVFQPRVFFPSKPALSDTEVYMRLARAFSPENMRMGTSISVGYMAENYADLGFPGMLVGIGALGLLLAGAMRMLLNNFLPQVIREGNMMGFAFAMARDGFLPRALARVNPATQVPSLAILAYAAVVTLLAATGTFASLVVLANIAALLMYLLCCLGVIGLRRRGVRLAAEPFTIQGGAIVPWLATAAILALLSTSNMAEIRAIADRVVVLRDGGLILDEPIADVTDDDIVTACLVAHEGRLLRA